MDKLDQTPQAQEIQGQTPSPISKSNNTKLLIFVLACVVIVLAIGAYALGTKQSQPVVQNSIQTTPSPSKASATEGDPTANWKTYVDKDFSFKYPNKWLTDNKQVYDPSTSFKGGNGGNETLYKKQLWFTEQAFKQSLIEYINQYYGNQAGFKSYDIATNNLNGKAFFNPLGEGTSGWYVAYSNGNNIVFFGPNSSDINQDETLKAIVNSFKFTQ